MHKGAIPLDSNVAVMLITSIIGSGALSALISGLFARASEKRKQNGQEQQKAKVDHDAIMLLMESDLRARLESAVLRGNTTTDELSLIHRMWNHYHYKMGGNGYLDTLMSVCGKLKITDMEDTKND